jgi:Flp pilus assembly protein TadD
LSLIDRAITLIPNYADAWSNKAACTGQLQRWDDCRVCARTAIRLNPANPISYIWLSRSQWALDNQQTAQQTLLKARRHPRVRQTTDLWIEYADNLATLGKPAAAARELIRAIGTHVGGEADAITKLIRSLHKLASQLGRESLFIRRASEACTNLESAPADLHYWRARHLLDSDQEKEAILVLMELVRSQPGHAQAWLELGRILRRQKNLHKAAACLERATREAPAEETAWTELCDCLVEDRKSDAALQQITKARLLHPENPKFLLAHCSLLIDEDQPQRAVKLLHGFHAARRMQPPAEALNIEGIALTRLHEFDAADRVFRHALRLAPTDGAIWNNRAICFGSQQRSRRETACYRKAIQQNPEDSGTHVNLAMAYLAQQDFERGMREYEWRLAKGGSLNAVVTGRLLQKGEQPDELHIVCEQGLGDTLQFVRYLYDLRRHLPSSRLILVCPGKLIRLIEHSITAVDACVASEEGPFGGESCTYLPLMSVPHHCGIHPHHSSAPKAYLRTEEQLLQRARAEVFQDLNEGTPVIALNWRGNPITERSNLRGRSTTLEELSLLAELIPEARFVSLQKGDGSEELEHCSFRQRFIPNQAAISAEWAFEMAAAYGAVCQCVVTTDTSMAHLAGALGLRTHVLLHSTPEWRWRSKGAASPWYPACTLASQERLGIWQPAVQRVAERIRTSMAAISGSTL